MILLRLQGFVLYNQFNKIWTSTVMCQGSKRLVQENEAIKIRTRWRGSALLKPEIAQYTVL